MSSCHFVVIHTDWFPKPFELWLIFPPVRAVDVFLYTPSVLSMSEWWDTVAKFRFMYPNLAPPQIRPVFTAPFRLQKHGEHSLLWGLGSSAEGCRKKDGWVGLWLGSNPSSWLVVVLETARLTLYTPSHTPFRTHTPLSPIHSYAVCPSLFSAAELNFSSLWVWLSARRAGEKVKSDIAFSCCYAGGHSEGIYEHAVFFGQTAKI